MIFSEDLEMNLCILRHVKQLSIRSFWWNNDAFVRLRPFCTCSSIGNQVDGLPIVLSKDAVSASSILPARAPIGIFRSKNDEVEKTCEVKCPGNLYFSEVWYSNASMWAIEWSMCSDRKKVIFTFEHHIFLYFWGSEKWDAEKFPKWIKGLSEVTERL